MSDSMTPMGETTPTFMRETPLTNATWLYPPRRVIEHSPGLYVWESTAPDLPCLSAIVSGNLGRRRKRPTESVALSTAPHDRRIHDMGGTNVAHFGRPFRADAITNVPPGPEDLGYSIRPFHGCPGLESVPASSSSGILTDLLPPLWFDK
jgi:hypothetical protein